MAKASATPSAASGPVTHRMLAQIEVIPAASSAPGRSLMARPARYSRDRPATTPAATARSRGLSACRRPSTSPSHTSGRKTGPWLEKMSRKGSPARIATADAANTPSSKVRWRSAKVGRQAQRDRERRQRRQVEPPMARSPTARRRQRWSWLPEATGRLRQTGRTVREPRPDQR